MRQTLRDAVTIAALTLLVGACTVEDVKDARAGDSIAAATSKSPASAQPAAAPGSAQAGNAASTNTPVAPVSSNTPAAPATSPSADTGTMAGRAAAPAAGAQGSLSPDSVDVGRRGKSSLVPAGRGASRSIRRKELTAFDGDSAHHESIPLPSAPRSGQRDRPAVGEQVTGTKNGFRQRRRRGPRRRNPKHRRPG